jgi:hypothetical protein
MSRPMSKMHRSGICTITLGKNTPYETWYCHIPSVMHLRVFGSTYYYLILKEQRNKLGARRQNFIFLGYLNTTKT